MPTCANCADTAPSIPAMHTHRSLVSSALHFMATWPFDQQTRWLVASPMFHTGGILATLATVWAGGTHVIIPRFDPDLAVDLIDREAVTHTLLVPTMLAAAAGAQLVRLYRLRCHRGPLKSVGPAWPHRHHRHSGISPCRGKTASRVAMIARST